MSELDRLTEACRVEPDDDAPRLVWADRVGGERGELVVIQCDLARGGLAPAEVAVRRRRERHLLASHGPAWGLPRHAAVYEFRRGFLEAAAIDTEQLVEDHQAIFRAAPLLSSVRAIGLTGSLRDDDGVQRGPDAVALVDRLIASPVLARLASLEIAGAGIDAQSGDGYDRRFEAAGDRVAERLARSGALRGLRGLGITSSGLGAAGAHALVASKQLGGLERLALDEPLGDDATLALLRATPRLASLSLASPVALTAIAPALPPLRALDLSCFGNGLRALIASPASAALETLRLRGELSPIGALAAFPRLRVLDLEHVHFAEVWAEGPPDRARFLEILATLRDLRSLAISDRLGVDPIAIADAIGDRLELFDLGLFAPPVSARELDARVAGEVHFGRPASPRALL